MNKLYFITMLWAGQEILSTKRWTNETEAWNEVRKLQDIANDNNFNVVYSVHELAYVLDKFSQEVVS